MTIGGGENNPDSPKFVPTVTIDTYQNDTEQAYRSGLLSGPYEEAGVIATVRGLHDAGLDIQARQNADALYRTLRVAHSFCVLMDVLGQGSASAPMSPGDAFNALQDTIIGPNPSLNLVSSVAPDPPPLYYGVCVIDSCPPSSASGGTSSKWASGGGSAAFYAEGGWKQAVDTAFRASMATVLPVVVPIYDYLKQLYPDGSSASLDDASRCGYDVCCSGRGYISQIGRASCRERV